ncbi:MAG: hypothetical protein PHV74_15140 [Dehalococcoidia bacterium]|nr:hypothetical protein [Dehalococcoidia bacterium]
MLRSGRWVSRLIGRWVGREQGQAMVMALIALTLGGLLITPVVKHVYTGVKAATVYKRLTGELYAADAGAEYGMWRIKGGLDSGLSAYLTVGGMPVDVVVSQLTELPYGPVITGDGTQSWRLQVSSALVNNGDGTFTDTITVANVGPSTIHLVQIGSGLPQGFTYVTGSTSGDITTADPSSINGNQICWTLDSHTEYTLDSGESAHHIFRIQGTGTPQGYYSWVIGNPTSIGTVSSCFGYHIVSQANGGTTITANVVKNEEAVFPVSWEVH